MHRKWLTFLYLLTLCILISGCNLQRDTFQIIYTATPGVTAASTAPATTGGSTTTAPTTTPTAAETATVWVSTKGGTKYHSKADCSSMTEAASLSLTEATEKGFTPCKRCYKENE